MFQIPTKEPKKNKKTVLYLMKDYNFSFFGNVYLEFFIQGFYQHLTEIGQLNWLDKTSLLSGLIIEFNLEICRRKKTFKHLKNNCRIKCLFIFVSYISALQLIKKEALAQVFSCEFCEISKNNLFTEHRWTAASESNIVILLENKCMSYTA